MVTFNNTPAMRTLNKYEVRYCCPQCGDEGFHLYYNLQKEVFHCFKCGYKGRNKPERVYSEEALEEMMAILKGKKNTSESKVQLVLPPCVPARVSKRAVEYMLKRGVPLYKMSEMGCMVSEADPSFDFRIIIPSYSLKGEINFYQARALIKSVKPKYLNPIVPKRNALFYNMSRKPTKCEHLYVVEGIFKAMQLWQIAEPAVAVFGKEVTDEQVKLIGKLTRDVTIMLDPDAFNFSINMAERMRMHVDFDRVRCINPPKAPDDLTLKELREVIS